MHRQNHLHGRAKNARATSAGQKQERRLSLSRESEEIIPLPREKAKVATRATDRVHHVRTYVIEEPFEKEVSLSDERLVVERRAATASKASKEGGKISERDYEFHERHEKPVVEIQTRTDEELVIRKEPTQHTERVTGTVRRLKAKIEKESAPAGESPPAPASHASASMKARSQKRAAR